MFSFLNYCGLELYYCSYTLRTAGDRIDEPGECKYQTKEENGDRATSVVRYGGLFPGAHDIYGKS